MYRQGFGVLLFIVRSSINYAGINVNGTVTSLSDTSVGMGPFSELYLWPWIVEVAMTL